MGYSVPGPLLKFNNRVFTTASGKGVGVGVLVGLLVGVGTGEAVGEMVGVEVDCIVRGKMVEVAFSETGVEVSRTPRIPPHIKANPIANKTPIMAITQGKAETSRRPSAAGGITGVALIVTGSPREGAITSVLGENTAPCKAATISSAL